MKENNAEDKRRRWPTNSVRWQEIETRLSVLWLALRIVLAVITVATAVGGVYVL